MSRYKRKRVYKTHTATVAQQCSICLGAIDPGDIYLRRELYRDGRYRGAVLKCDQCVTIQEVNSSGTE